VRTFGLSAVSDIWPVGRIANPPPAASLPYMDFHADLEKSVEKASAEAAKHAH